MDSLRMDSLRKFFEGYGTEEEILETYSSLKSHMSTNNLYSRFIDWDKALGEIIPEILRIISLNRNILQSSNREEIFKIIDRFDFPSITDDILWDNCANHSDETMKYISHSIYTDPQYLLVMIMDLYLKLKFHCLNTYFISDIVDIIEQFVDY